jgi:quinol monooxygenase YgiN
MEAMILRLVRLPLRPEAVSAFLELYGRIRPELERFPGCRSVTLLRDAADPCVLATLSYWDSLEELERYRRSALFARTCPQVRALLVERAQVWTYELDAPAPL